MGIYTEAEWKTLFPDADNLAKGRFGAGVGLRRYGASKLCQIMMV